MQLRYYLSSSAVLALALAGTPASAQIQAGPATTPPPPGTAQSSNDENANVQASGPENSADAGLADIVVTAQKRAENVQDIPKSVQVVDSAQLQQQNILSLDDLRKVVPSISGSNNGTNVSIRGVASNASTVGAQTKVGVVLDDVPQPSRATLANNLLDIDRVEVLPGPQGTLSGRNATGGLINLVTRSPSKEWTGLANFLITSDHQVIGSAYISGPVTDNLAFSLSGYENYFRGLSYNLYDGKWSDSDVHGLRGKLRFTPTDKLTITGTAFYQRSSFRNVDFSGSTPNAAQVFSYLSVPQTSLLSSFDLQTPTRNFAQLKPGIVISPTNRAFYSVLDGRTTTSDYGGILRFDYQLGDATLSSISSYLHETNPNDQPFYGVPLTNMNYRPEFDGYAHYLNKTDYKTQEVRLTSPTTKKLQYVVGAFYSDNDNIYNYSRYVLPVDWDRNFGQKSIAAFGHLSYELPTRTTLQGGLRFEKDSINYTWVFNPILATSKTLANGTVQNFPFINAATTSSNHNSQSFTNYDIGLQQKFGERIMAYVTYGKASQGAVYDSEDNTLAIKQALPPLPSEEVKDVEVGIKTEFFNRHLIVDLNYFNANYSNYQVSTTTTAPNDPNAVPVIKLSAIGKVRTSGAEANIQTVLASWFRFNVFGSYTDAKIIDFPNAPCYTGQTAAMGCITGIPAGELVSRSYQTNLAGGPLASSPKWKIILNPSFRLPVDSLRRGAAIVATANYRYQSSQNTDILGSPYSSIGSKNYIDATLGIRTPHYSIELLVNNLTNESAETYATTISGFILPAGASVQRRNLSREDYRYVGLRLGAHF